MRASLTTHLNLPTQVDPFIADVGSAAWIGLQPHQEAAVTRAAANLTIALTR